MYPNNFWAAGDPRPYWSACLHNISYISQDTAEVIKKFMARDPDSLNFTVVALSKSD